MIDLEETLMKCLDMTRNYDDAPDWAHGLKLGEECGEVQEAILKANGFLDHKELNEGVVEEVADVINVLMALLTAHYPDLTIYHIATKLDNAMKQKNQKYYEVLTKRKEK